MQTDSNRAYNLEEKRVNSCKFHDFTFIVDCSIILLNQDSRGDNSVYNQLMNLIDGHLPYTFDFIRFSPF